MGATSLTRRGAAEAQSDWWAEAVTLGDLLLRTAARHPERDAVVFPDERLSYAELAERARTFARGLIGLGIGAGEKVGVLMANSPDCVATIYAIALAGATVVPINTRYRAVELPYVITNAELAAIVTSDRIDDYVDLLGLIQEALPGLAESAEPDRLALAAAPLLRAVAVLGSRRSSGTVDEASLLEAAATVTEAELDHRRAGVAVRGTALVLYTSGTTAQPRGCILTHEALVRCWTNVGRVFAMDCEDRCWAPCPLFHLGAVGPLLMCAAHGAAFVSDTFFEATSALGLLERERPTILYPAYPPITQAVLTHPAFAGTDVSAARAMLNVGPPDLLRQMQSALPHVIQLSLYGLTEGGGAITYNRLGDDLDVRVETCGTALPGADVRVIDPETGADRPHDEPGEIVIRGVSVCEGYYRDPEKTARQFDGDGWFHTGDRGSLDQAGRLRFLGRLKDMLKVGGENVAPAEIEAHLGLHPAVKLVQVVGVPDERLEEVPAAFVELKPGRTATAEDLLEHCRDQIARFKVPRYIRFVNEWPMSATKVQKEPLRQQLIEELADSAASSGSPATTEGDRR
jgi:acyl-CoA synthetase (AMP-forming)/AMP-acid ligase II